MVRPPSRSTHTRPGPNSNAFLTVRRCCGYTEHGYERSRQVSHDDLEADIVGPKQVLKMGAATMLVSPSGLC